MDRLVGVRASAGTGKTYRLVTRLLALLLNGVQPESILGTTFTRAAAAEIRERLLLSLAKGLTSPEGLERIKSSVDPEATSIKLGQILSDIILSEKSPKILTIDSFLSNVARSFTFEIGLNEDWRIASEGETVRALDRALMDLMEHEDVEKLGTLSRLVKDDRLVKSISGSLKGELQAGFSLWREGGIDAEKRILSWSWPESYKRVAKEEVEEITSELKKAELPQNKDGSVDKIYFSAVEKLVLFLRSGDYRSAIEELTIIQKIALGETAYNRKPIPLGLMAPLQSAAAAIKRNIGAGVYFKGLALYELFNWYEKSYFDRIIEHGIPSFDDLKHLFLGENTADWLEVISFRMDTGFDHLFFDEFQDTSLIQWRLFHRLIEEIYSSENKSLFIVGDSKQAIYGWRGGVKRLFDSVIGQLKEAGGKIDELELSYRSSPAVLEIVNKVFSELSKNTGAHSDAIFEWSEGFLPHQSFNPKLEGQASAVVVNDETELLNTVVRVAAEIVAKSRQTSVGVLVRSNQRLRELARLFESAAIPASQEGGSYLGDEELAQVLLALLKMIDHPGDTISRFLVANSIFADGLSYKNWKEDETTDTWILKAREEVEAIGIFSYLELQTRAARRELSSEDEAVLDEFLDVALQEEARLGPRLYDLAPAINSHRFNRAQSAQIRLLTVHAAKGLEFDVTLLAELDCKLIGTPNYLVKRTDPLMPPSRIVRYEKEGVRALFPEMQQLHDDNKSALVEEALSVLYVMLTRARTGMFLFARADLKTESFQKLLFEALGMELTPGTVTLSGTDGLYL